jgi:hypothetical protein
LTAVEAIIDFIIDIYKGMLVNQTSFILFIFVSFSKGLTMLLFLQLCMADFVVHGTLSIAIDTAQLAETFFAGIANSTRTDVLNLVNGVNSEISKASSVVDKIPG